MKDSKKMKFALKVGSIATALAVTAVTGFAYTAPSTYVSLDVNPSIEYSVNAFDRVIRVVAVNDDGEKIVNELDLRNDKIEKAIEKTIEKLKQEGYITNDDYSGIVIAVSNKDKEKSDELSENLKEKLNDKDIDETEKEKEGDIDKEEKDEVKIEDEKKYADEEKSIEIIVESVGRERVEEAKKLGVTPGKLNLVQKLIISTYEFDEIEEDDLQELLSLSVKEINKMRNESKKEAKLGKTDVKELKDEDLEDNENDDINKDEDEEEKTEKEKSEKVKNNNKPAKETKEKTNENKVKKNN